jgi:hypothetical protein
MDRILSLGPRGGKEDGNGNHSRDDWEGGGGASLPTTGGVDSEGFTMVVGKKKKKK